MCYFLYVIGKTGSQLEKKKEIQALPRNILKLNLSKPFQGRKAHEKSHEDR